MVTLENRTFVVQLDDSGVGIMSAMDDQPFDQTKYDSVNSLLLNISTGFVEHFNSSLAKALARVAQERGEAE